MDGVLDFIDTSDMTLMNRQEHTKVTDLAWDPTGRYVVSSLSFWTEKVFCIVKINLKPLYSSGHRIICTAAHYKVVVFCHCYQVKSLVLPTMQCSVVFFVTILDAI